MLFAIAVAGAVVATGSIIWHQETQRQRERELLRIGHAFRDAIGRYHQRSPGTQRRYPEKLDDLLLDLRYLSLERHLRRIYRDPMTAKAEWGLVPAPEGGIMGVHSLSTAAPIKTGGFDDDDALFAGKSSYAEWKFVYRPAAESHQHEPGAVPKPHMKPPSMPPRMTLPGHK